MKVTIHYNGIKVDGKLIKCYIWKNLKGVVISARRYGCQIPRELFRVSNETDIMTDYFERDSALVTENHPLYKYLAWAADTGTIRVCTFEVRKYKKYLEKDIPDYLKKDYLGKVKECEDRIAKVQESMVNPGQPSQDEIAKAVLFIREVA